MAKVKIQVHIEESDYKEITRLSKKLGHKEPILLRKLLSMGLDDALLLEKSGFLSFVMKAGEIMNKFKQQFLFDGKKEISIDDLKDM